MDLRYSDLFIIIFVGRTFTCLFIHSGCCSCAGRVNLHCSCVSFNVQKSLDSIWQIINLRLVMNTVLSVVLCSATIYRAYLKLYSITFKEKLPAGLMQDNYRLNPKGGCPHAANRWSLLHKTFGFKDGKLWLSITQGGVKGFIWIHPVRQKGRYLSIHVTWARGS